MSDIKILNEIYYENRAINRNLHRVCSIGFTLLFMNVLKEAKERGNEGVQMMGRIALLLVAIIQFLIAGIEVADFMKKKEGRVIFEAHDKGIVLDEGLSA